MSMLDLFRLEAESQVQVLTAGLLALERQSGAADQLEACMRAAHSLKGAARIVGLEAGVRVAHVMEDCFVAAQRGSLSLQQAQIDLLLRGVDLLGRIAGAAEGEQQPSAQNHVEVDAFVAGLTAAMVQPQPAAPAPGSAALPVLPAVAGEVRDAEARALRVTPEDLNRLLGVAGESLVESRWLKSFAGSLLRLKRLHQETAKSLDSLREALPEGALNDYTRAGLTDVQYKVLEFRRQLAERLVELEMFDRRSTGLARRLYDEALACRMRPFSDIARAFPRMVRDLARALGKEARLEIVGEATRVDRDILQKLEAPLGHLLRNALDHGIGTPEQRRAAGKPPEGTVRLEARHSAGTLQISVSDDGRGVDLDKLRQGVVERNLTNAETAARMSEAELLEFLFLPGFTLKDNVTEISGRGVGLDAVQNLIRQVRGAIRISSEPGRGTRFQLQLPLSLSVVRTLLAEIGGEPYAFPLAYIAHTLKLPRQRIELLEGRQLFEFDGRRLGLVSAMQVLQGEESRLAGEELPVIVIGDGVHAYGLVVDRFLGERELVVQALDARLGKIKDIAAGALMENGAPVLIVDVEDLLRSVEKLIAGGHLSRVQQAEGSSIRRKRVLVVDDSLTVRELERKLLDNVGYEVEVAVDGMDGWNAVRTGRFDLVVTDIDMPRLDGIELVTMIKGDAHLKALPVMIVSYKDREEDRRRGLDAGADYYLAKGSFHDQTLLQAVVDLIGEAAA